MGLPESLVALIGHLKQLPGIGPRSAERLALHLAQSDKHEVEALADTMVRARTSIQWCSICGAMTETQPCAICQDPRRDADTICVVERAVDIFSIEKAGTFRGRYHVLGGRISPVNGVGPEDLRIGELERRLAENSAIKEIIIALGADVEGDATSLYLARCFGTRGLKLSRLALGLPVGGSLEFADELTLGRAIEGRRPIS